MSIIRKGGEKPPPKHPPPPPPPPPLPQSSRVLLPPDPRLTSYLRDWPCVRCGCPRRWWMIAWWHRLFRGHWPKPARRVNEHGELEA